MRNEAARPNALFVGKPYSLTHFLNVLTISCWSIINIQLSVVRGVSETSDRGHRSHHSL